MGSITLTVTGAVNSGSKGFTVSDADILRIINSYTAEATAYYQAKGIAGPYTNALILAYLVYFLKDSIMNHVASSEYQANLTTAVNAVAQPTPPTFT